ncbi:receptor-like serine/threonine-protein kinase ALE2 isoform X2 [Lotus japonicus]|uniref:receptor-like serine/threonine-protein kinase ALE2 isoform X2 n=1 Tax=Lotus japonicus TaxID=34305 RepID=UPI00258AB6F5|nr:receptor-like serine/threonine-protein kinase ALE2 isoform X2 [Lotus japonicus]
MKMGMVVLALILQLVKLSIIGFAVAAQGPEGSLISPSPAFFPVIHPRGPGPIHHGQSWGKSASSPSESDGFVTFPSPATLPVDPAPSEAPGLSQPRNPGRTMAPSSPDVPNGSFLHPPVTSPPPTSAPSPRKIKGIEPSISHSPSPSTIALAPSHKVFPSPPTAERNVPPSIQLSPPQRIAPAVRPPESTPIAPGPFPIPSGNFPKVSPASQPIEHGSLPPKVDTRNENKSHNIEPISPAPFTIPSRNFPKFSPASQPIEHGSLPPKVDTRNENKSHNVEPISPAPVATPSANLPKISPVNHPTENGSLPPNAHREGPNKGQTPESISPAPVFNIPKHSPVSQPTNHGSFPPTVHRMNSSTGHTLEPVSQAPLAIPSANFPKNSPVSQPTINGSFPPDVHDRTANKGHTHTPEPVMPSPVQSPTSPFPVDPPLAYPVIPVASPSKLPDPVISRALTPSTSFNWKKGGEPVSAPLYKTPKPLPAAHSPAHAPTEHKARQFHHAPKPLTSSPKSPPNEEDHSPSSPSTTYYKHHHSRKTIISPAPASSYLVSPPVSKHQGQPTPPLSPPKSGRRHHAPPPMDTGSSVSPFNFPIQSPRSQVSPAPSPSFKIFPHPTKIPFHPPKVSPSRPSSKNNKKPIPQVQALPPPPPNEDCLSTVCSEPYVNSPPGAPCRCVWPMKVGLRLSVPLYTFFPLVSELASEIATGVFMTQSQVRIMGANEATQQPDKTDALIDLVPLGEEFDNTTAFLTSDRFWHKKVAIKASNFGDYKVLYVSYPGLPPSPPLPPSSINMIDGGPYSIDGNNGRTIKPLGVDIPKRQQKGGLSKGVIAIIALSVFLAVVLCSAAALAVFKCREHVSQSTLTPPVLPSSLTKTPGTARSIVGGVPASASSSSFRSSIAAYTGSAKTFSLKEIEKATDNFHASRILGEGGFGLVYGGNLEDGTKVAVKVLKREDHHGDREFLSEVEMLSRLHHRNLVKLIGICSELSSRCLVYELVPNGSVESHLHGDDRERSALDWSTRIKIALGAARGLAYLHEDSSPHVIHRDFKSSNILLEDDFTPKVSDFGLARTAADGENRHISTRVMGTFGYVAPEYAMTGHLLVKSDVYSYGVVLLELLTGRKPIDMSQPPGQENLVAWARPLLTSKEGLEALIDPSLGTDVPFDSVAKVAAIASMCVQPEVSDRPFMGEVVQALKLVCNECDEAKEAGSRGSSREDLSVDSITHLDNFQGHFSDTYHDSEVDIERGLSASDLFSSSARLRRQASGSFRMHSYSGPLRTGRSQQLWQIIRKLSGGSVSEHGPMFKS